MKSSEREQDRATLVARLDDQQERIEALARGREDDLETISQLRAELALVARERDSLRRQLMAVESMQTETLTQGDEPLLDLSEQSINSLPSIDELMTAFSGLENTSSQSHSTLRVEPADADAADDYQEMLAPEEMVLDSRSARSRPVQRCLLLVDAEQPTQYPLNQNLMTIGRSESADIQVDADFISRIHARVLMIGMDVIIEDAGSKNGTRVNAELVERHVLKHGDLIRIGSARFRYFDGVAVEADAE
jgi:hypothetical protein